jgi:hypothetical protein
MVPMRHIKLPIAAALLTLLISPSVMAEETATYCMNSTRLARVVNIHAVQQGLSADELTVKVVSASDVVDYIQAKRPEYLSAHPDIRDWLKDLSELNAVAAQIAAPELEVDSFYIPEPFEGDVPFVYNGLLIYLSNASKAQTDTCFGYEVGYDACVRVTGSGTTGCLPCPTDPEHPIYDLGLSKEDQVVINQEIIGQTWKIRCSGDSCFQVSLPAPLASKK